MVKLPSASAQAAVPDYVALQPGIHQLQVTDVREQYSQASGDEYWRMTYASVEKPGAKMSDRLFFSAPAMKFTNDVFRCLGLTPEEYAGNVELDASTLIGLTGQFRVTNRIQDGHTSNVLGRPVFTTEDERVTEAQATVDALNEGEGNS